METLKKYFPHAFKSNTVNEFIVALIIYAVIGIIGGTIIGLLKALPIIGIVFSVVGAVLEVYTLVGVVLSILVFVKVVK